MIRSVLRLRVRSLGSAHAYPRDFGALPDGRPVRRLELGTAPGPVLHLLDLGATAHRLEVTGPDGVRRNVLLGFDRRLWDVVEQDDAAATLELLSPDGDQGFPGDLRARVRASTTTS